MCWRFGPSKCSQAAAILHHQTNSHNPPKSRHTQSYRFVAWMNAKDWKPTFRSQWVSSLEVSKGHISNILMSSFPPNGGQNELTTRRPPSLQTHVALRIGFSASDATDVFESLCWGLRLWNLFEVLKFTWTIWNYRQKLDFKSNLSKNTLILPKQTSEVLTFRQVIPDL